MGAPSNARRRKVRKRNRERMWFKRQYVPKKIADMLSKKFDTLEKRHAYLEKHPALFGNRWQRIQKTFLHPAKEK